MQTTTYQWISVTFYKINPQRPTYVTNFTALNQTVAELDVLSLTTIAVNFASAHIKLYAFCYLAMNSSRFIPEIKLHLKGNYYHYPN